jgi:hypothetical protein
MPEEQNPQQVGPGQVPGMVSSMPQADPAAVQGPDSHSMPNLGDVLQKPERNYEESFKGLNKWVTTEFNQLRSTVTEMANMMKQLAPQQPQAAPAAPAPVSGGKKEAPSQTVDPLDVAIQSKKAQQYRDLLLDEYTKPGAPFEGLPLHLFAQNIPVHPPTLNEDQTLNDKAQRGAIEAFAQALKGVQGQTQQSTQQALMEGFTPGSAVGAPPPGGKSGDDIYQEFLDAMNVMGSKEFLDLSKDEQARVEETYYRLLEDSQVKERHGGSTRPTLTFDEMAKKINELSKQVAKFQGRMPTNMR